MAPVDVTILYSLRQQADLSLPENVPSQFLAEAIARALSLHEYQGKTLNLIYLTGEEHRTISPASTLTLARVRAGSLLMLEPVEIGSNQGACLISEGGLRFYLKDVNQIGRPNKQQNTLVDIDLSALDLNKVTSHKHAMLRVEAGKYLLFDTSKNGTFVNQQRLEGGVGCELIEGDAIDFGPAGRGVRLKFTRQI